MALTRTVSSSAVFRATPSRAVPTGAVLASDRYVLADNEVLLYGKRLPLRGPVQPVLVSVFPPKFVLGDYTKETKQLTSSWISDDWQGGCGKRYLDATVDTDRFDFSTCNTRFKKQLTLADEVVGCGGVAGKSNVLAGVEYGNTMYAVFDDTVVSWDDAAKTLSAALHVLTGAGSDAAVFRLSSGASAGQAWAFFAHNDGVHSFNGAVWTETVSAGDFKYLRVWDDKLFAIGSNGVLKYTTDGASWTTAATLGLPAGVVTGLVEFYTVDGNPALHVATKQGVFVYDATAGKLRATKFQVPQYKYGGLGTNEWRGALYYPAAFDVYEYNISNLVAMGLSRDYGLPAQYKGNIVATAPSLSALYAALDNQSPVPATLPARYTTAPFGTAEILPQYQGQGLLMLWSGRGWHTAYDQADISKGMKWVKASTANDKYRLWFGSAGHLKYIEISQAVHNPLFNPAQRFQASGYLISGWFDAAWSELQKLAIRLNLRTKGCSSTEKVRVYYGTDDSPTWTLLGEFTTDGVHEMPFSAGVKGERGVEFYSIRFKLELQRGSDATKTPVVEFFGLEFLKTQDASWGFSMVVDATREYKGTSVPELVAWLRELANKKPEGVFTYKDTGGTVERYVKVSRMAGFEYAGEDGRGYYQLSVVEL